MKLDFSFLKNVNLLKMITGFAIIAVFIFHAIALVYIEIPERNETLFTHMMGMVEGAFIGNLCAYYFGSSKKEHDLVNDTRSEQPQKPV
jgi:hypothetical protein